MDAMRHVNNIVYFRYFESVRVAYFERIGFLQMRDRIGIGPILAYTHCKFKLPLTYPDTVSVGTRISKVEEDRFVMEYYVVSHKLGQTAAEGEGRVVCYNYNENAKAPLPEAIKQRIRELEHSGGRGP
jgi:acyl-CoA thioester hydrolase